MGGQQVFTGGFGVFFLFWFVLGFFPLFLPSPLPAPAVPAGRPSAAVMGSRGWEVTGGQLDRSVGQ